MTGESLTPLFEGKEIRVTGPVDDPWFPVYDLAMAWGIDRNTPRNLIDRNKEIFDGMTCYVTYPSEDESGEDERALCVNERGLYLMLGRINADRLKNPEARAAIIRFQRWVPELIQKWRKQEIVEVQQPPRIEEELERARHYAELTGTEPRAFQAAVFRKHGMPEFAEVLQVPAPALPSPDQPGIWMIPQDIGRECGLSSRQVNQWLYNHDFQYPDGSVWRLTVKGESYGEEYPFTSPYKHTEIRIRWHRSILIASGLKRPMPESQTALPAHG